MACCFLILLWVQDELSYDRFHENYNKIHKVLCKGKEILNDYDGTPAPLAEAAKESIPDVENYVRILGIEKKVIEFEYKSFYESGGIYADPSLFSVFTFPLSKGDPQ